MKRHSSVVSHVFRDDAVATQWPHLYDQGDIHSKAVEAAEGVLARGVKTVCKSTAMYGGHDVALLERIAAETGIQIVACTGI